MVCEPANEPPTLKKVNLKFSLCGEGKGEEKECESVSVSVSERGGGDHPGGQFCQPSTAHALHT